MSEDRTNVDRAYAPMEFRFTEPEDVRRYGDRWYSWDEASIIRLPARDLIRLESELGMPIIDVCNGVRVGSVLGDTAAAWISLHLADPERAGEFDDFNPSTLTIVWRKVEPGKAPAATADPSEAAPDTPARPDTGSQPVSLSNPGTSGTAPTVALPIMPISA